MAAYMHCFDMETQLRVGKKGEDVFLAYVNQLKEDGKITEVIDVREDPQTQKDDVDFIVRFANGKTYSFEIKGDEHETGNLYVETGIDSLKDGQFIRHDNGWIYKTKATFVFYVMLATQEVYVATPKAIVAYTNEAMRPGSGEIRPRSASALNFDKEDRSRSWYANGYCIKAEGLYNHRCSKDQCWKLLYADYDEENKTAKFQNAKLAVPF